MAHAPHSVLTIHVFIQHARYKVVFVLCRELVAMCSRAHIVNLGLLRFRKQLPQSMTWVGRDGPKESLVSVIGLVGEGLSIPREEPSPTQLLDTSFQPASVMCGREAPSGRFCIQHGGQSCHARHLVHLGWA